MVHHGHLQGSIRESAVSFGHGSPPFFVSVSVHGRRELRESEPFASSWLTQVAQDWSQ